MSMTLSSVDQGLFRRFADLSPVAPELLPGAGWNGTAGSGWVAPMTVPVDPVRLSTSAKSALRLIVPPFQRFTDYIDVIAIAAANENGTLFNNFGIANLTFHLEGNTAVVAVPAYHIVETQRGPRSYFGWKVRVRRRATGIRDGNYHLYIESTPRDGTMQKRVIGPFIFSPQSQVFDLELNVAPSQPQVTGVSYTTLGAAVAYAKGVSGVVNPLITIKQAGLYSITDVAGDVYTRAGYCNITSDVPLSGGLPQVWIGTTSDTASNTTMPDSRQKLRIFGTNIGLDFRFMEALDRRTAGAGFQHWLDGVVITSTAPTGRNAMWRGGPRFVSSSFVGGPWFTECVVSEVVGWGNFAALIRGCTVNRTVSDCVSSAACIVHSTFDDHDSGFWNSNTSVFTIRYDGAASVVTLSKRGGRLGAANADGNGMFRVTIDGVNNDYVVGDSSPTSRSTAGRRFNDVVAWLNTIPGITATTTDPENRGAYSAGLGPEHSSDFPDGTKGGGWGFPANTTGPLDIKGVTRTIVSQFDQHADWYQHNSGTLENRIVLGNKVTRFTGQIVFLSPTGTSSMLDVFFIGNSFERPVLNAGNFSSIGRQTNTLTVSHLVFAYNSMATQSLRLWGNANQPPANSYNLIGYNALPGIFRESSSAWPGLPIVGNHLPAGATAPTGANTTGTTFGGATSRDFYVDVDNGDFRPAAPLLAALKAPALRFDAAGNRRGATAPVGALSL